MAGPPPPHPLAQPRRQGHHHHHHHRQHTHQGAAKTTAAAAAGTGAAVRLDTSSADPPAPAAPTTSSRHHHGGHHASGGHHRGKAAAPATAPSSSPTSAVPLGSAAAGYPYTTTSKTVVLPPPAAAAGSAVSGAGIAGIVLSILFTVGVLGFVVHRVLRQRRHRDPFLAWAPGNRMQYWRQGQGHGGIVSPPPEEADQFDQDFKNWVEVVGSAQQGGAKGGSGASTKSGTSGGSIATSASDRRLERIPSGSEALGVTASGSLVFASDALIPEKREGNRTGDDRNRGRAPIINTPISPITAPPGFTLGEPRAVIEPPPFDLGKRTSPPRK